MEDSNTTGFFNRLGEVVIRFFISVYEIFSLILQTLRSLPSIWFYRRQVVEQFSTFLLRTLPIASIIAIFVGLGAMVQGQYQATPFVPREYTINVIFKTTILELGPIVLALVLAGKLGASLAAEIGSMKITEQIEALETLSLDPVGFLIMPRVLAGIIMLPVITIFANILSILSMFVVSALLTEWISPQGFIQGLQIGFREFEIYFGSLIKPSFYGFTIALIGSHFGMTTHGGALGVGKSSTNAVVVSAVLIVFFDYYLAKVLL